MRDEARADAETQRQRCVRRQQSISNDRVCRSGARGAHGADHVLLWSCSANALEVRLKSMPSNDEFSRFANTAVAQRFANPVRSAVARCTMLLWRLIPRPRAILLPGVRPQEGSSLGQLLEADAEKQKDPEEVARLQVCQQTTPRPAARARCAMPSCASCTR